MLGCIGFSNNSDYYEPYTAEDLEKPLKDCGINFGCLEGLYSHTFHFVVPPAKQATAV
jgi:hypothetical protein